MFHVVDDVLPLLFEIEHGHSLDLGTRFARDAGRVEAKSRVVELGAQLLEDVAQHDSRVAGQAWFDLLYAFFQLDTFVGCSLVLVSQLITITCIKRLLRIKI